MRGERTVHPAAPVRLQPYSMTSHAAVIAAHRFGLGAWPGILDSIDADPGAWLRSQLSRFGRAGP